MYESCTPKCFQDSNSCCNGCIKNDGACDYAHTAEFPKCCGPYTEEKFSKMENMFLTSNSKCKKKGESCSCASKKMKANKKCVEKAKDCKCSKEEDKNEEDKSDEDVSDYPKKNENATEAMQNGMGPGMFGFGPNIGTMDNCTPGIITASVNEFEAFLPTNPTLGLEYANNNQLPALGYASLNQTPQQPWEPPAAGVPIEQQRLEIPAAGMPSEQSPRFDPCTGQECPEPAKTAQLTKEQMQRNEQYSRLAPPTVQEFPGATKTAQLPKEQVQRSEPSSRFAPRTGPQPTKTALLPMEHVQSGNKKTFHSEFSEPPRSVFPQVKDLMNKPDYQLIRCNNVSPELIERICKPQTGRPENCYILLPIEMSTQVSQLADSAKSKNSLRNTKKTKSATNLAKKKRNMELSRHESQGSSSARGSTDSDKPSLDSKAAKPTRNCGCNTLISGSAEDKKNDGDKEQPSNSCVCQPGCCCCPCSCSYSYYYNPYLGCYCWYKKRCCYGCNGCNNYCNSCCNSCPMPAKSNKQNGNSQPKQTESPSKRNSQETKQKHKKSTPESGSEQRIVAGSVTPFAPNVQALYEQWLESQRFINGHPTAAPTRPPTPIPSGAFYYSTTPGYLYYPFHHQQMQLNNNHFKTPSSNEAEPQPQATDIDWTPH